jgi:hypothetical protein
LTDGTAVVKSRKILGASFATQEPNVRHIHDGIFGHESTGFLSLNNLAVRALGELACHHKLTTGFGARAVVGVDGAKLHLQERITSEFTSRSLQVATELADGVGEDSRGHEHGHEDTEGGRRRTHGDNFYKK